MDTPPTRDPAPDASRPRPELAVIIPVYNDLVGLERCLRSLAAQTYPSDRYDIVLVDNGSTSDPAPLAATLGNPRLLRESRPGSYAARNTGIAETSADILAFIDSDCIADPRWLARGVAMLESDRCEGVVGGRVAMQFAESTATAVELYDAVTFFNQEKYVCEQGFAVTANLFVRRGVFDRAGVFNAALKSGGDREWGERCTALGITLRYAGDAVVMHPARRTLGEITLKTRRVAGGLRTLTGGGLSRKPRRSLVQRLGGPFARSLALWRDSRLTRRRDRAQVIAISWLMTLVTVYELLRLRMGGAARRS